MEKETATFAAGCFWGVEAEFLEVEGVIDTTVGYTGGHLDNPTYKDVCSGETGHAEAVQVEYDPDQVTYAQLLDLFWSMHDPTQGNRQGPDVGSQYRSAVFYHTPEQSVTAHASKDKLQATLSRPITTEIVAVSTFWPAEDYHQKYVEKHGGGKCH